MTANPTFGHFREDSSSAPPTPGGGFGAGRPGSGDQPIPTHRGYTAAQAKAYIMAERARIRANLQRERDRADADYRYQCDGSANHDGSCVMVPT
jgi:hypothetical protein